MAADSICCSRSARFVYNYMETNLSTQETLEFVFPVYANFYCCPVFLLILISKLPTLSLAIVTFIGTCYRVLLVNFAGQCKKYI